MTLEAGRQLLQYRLVETIGQGGMGIVWKALDTALDREVAIKVLPDDFATDPDRLARFEREAKLLATLNHPNIAAVYGLHEVEDPSGPVRFIAMELVEGETLADRLARSAMTVEDTAEIGKQIAEALEAAHDRGIVHRDLKPANVKVRTDGTVKVLDFGLARAVSGDPTSGSDPESPTVTAGTRPGVILGTVPYMSPEQARGKPIDRRTDIWSLGCVLYECLTARRAFDGESTTDVLASIVTRPPDFDALPAATPRFLARLLRRCLDKDSRRRLRDAGELRVAIEAFQAGSDLEIRDAAAAPTRRGSMLRSVLPWGLVVVLAVWLATVLLGGTDRPGVATAGVSKWVVPLPAGSRVALPSPGGGFDYSRTVAVSRDGSQIAFTVSDADDRTALYVKGGSRAPRRIPETDNARGPFFSPDGDWVGFYDNDDNAVHKVALAGGSPQKLCTLDKTLSFDASWAPDGATIVFATDDGLWRVSADGGAIEPLTEPAVERGEVGHHFPRFTADGRGVLFTVSATPETHVALLDLGTGTWDTVIPNVASAVPVGPDRVVVARSGELLAAPYDPVGHRVVGSMVPVLQGLQTTPGLAGVVLTQFDVSDTGVLAYAPAPAAERPDRLLWVDMQGDEELIAEGPGTWVHPRLSPDGTRISLDIHSSDGMRDLYIYELERKQLRQLTRTGMTWESEWRPDGRRIALLSGAPAGQWSLFWIPTDFSAPAELLHRSSHAIPGSWLPDGRTLLFSEWVEGGIWRIEPEGDRVPGLVLQTEAREGWPRLSPDGAWITFVETESGRREVFVQSFPEAGARHQVSVDGGREPVWSRDGRRLFFRNDDGMYAVDVRCDTGIRFDAPRLLFRGEYDTADVGHQHYDVARDSDRFLMIRHGEPEGPFEVHVVLNWLEELKSR
jgi:serine/threonine-protein kinase